MILAMIWKEWREQRTIALAILAFGTLALVLTAQFAEPVGGRSVVDAAGARELMGPALAFLAGMVCGAVLLADEKEVGTIEFLDSLPSTRCSLWFGKAIFGILFTTVQAVFFAALSLTLDCGIPRVTGIGYIVALSFIGLLSFAWGILGGALCRSTLGAVFVGAFGSFLAGILLTIPIIVVFGARQLGRTFGLSGLVHFGTWVGMGLVLSAIVFTGLDRRRWNLNRQSIRLVYLPRRLQGAHLGFFALIWLTLRQGRIIILSAIIAGIVVGAIMALPESHPLVLWSSGTLVLGVLAGITALGEEQTRGVARFWAERRLPLGRLWLVKVSGHFAIASFAALLMFLPIFAASPSALFRSRLWSPTEFGLRDEIFRFLFLSMVYGFVFGHLASLLFRKTVVAGLVAAVCSATVVALVAPSVIGGGASSWQVWGPAGILLVTARLFLYPWATDRTVGTGPLLRVTAGGVLVVMLLALSTAYRVYQIPDVDDRLVSSGFLASLPSFQENETGRQLRAAIGQYRRSAEETKALYPAPTVTSRSQSFPGRSNLMSQDETDPLDQIAYEGWTANSNRLRPWLNRMFADGWPAILEDLQRRPMGVLEDPRDINYFSSDNSHRDLREMLQAVRARGLQLQADGDPTAFVEFLPGSLAACRTAKFKSSSRGAEVALLCEEIVLVGVFDWLSKLDGRADLIREVASHLDEHIRDMPTDTEDSHWANQMVLRNTLDGIGNWLPDVLDGERNNGEPSRQAEGEAEVINVAWSVPWERIRRNRILRVYSHQDLTVNRAWLSGLHLRNLWRPDRTNHQQPRERRNLTLRRITRVILAIRLYQLEHGRSVDHLKQLDLPPSPDLLIDPYSNRPFGYRVTTGETIEFDSGGPAKTLSPNEQLSSRIGQALVLTDGGMRALVEVALVNGPARTGMMLIGMAVTVGQSSIPVRPVKVPSGTSVIWSVGADGENNQGRRTPPRFTQATVGQDWIFIVSFPTPKHK